MRQAVTASVAEVSATRRRLHAVFDAERNRLEEATAGRSDAQLERVPTLFAQFRSE